MDIIAGDDTDIEITLKSNGAVFSISNSAVIKAAIIDRSRSAVLIGPVTVDRTVLGSDWMASLIVVQFPGRMSESIRTSTQAKLEIQVYDGGRKVTWTTDITLIKSLIK